MESTNKQFVKALTGSSKKARKPSQPAMFTVNNAISSIRSEIRKMVRDGSCSYTSVRMECRPCEIKQHCKTLAHHPWSAASVEAVSAIVDEEFELAVRAGMLPSDWLSRTPENQIRWGW